MDSARSLAYIVDVGDYTSLGKRHRRGSPISERNIDEALSGQSVLKGTGLAAEGERCFHNVDKKTI
jgi:hypothetical protein